MNVSKTLKVLSTLSPRPFVYCDVGARFGISEPWATFSPLLQLVSFEPDAEEYERLLKNQREGHLIPPVALDASVGEANLHLTQTRGVSSLYQPDSAYVSRFLFLIYSIFKISWGRWAFEDPHLGSSKNLGVFF